MRNHYEILDVPRDATADQIKAAYRFQLTAFHPDKFVDGSDHAEKAQRRFEEIVEAYKTLSEPRSRAEYDRFQKYTESAVTGSPGSAESSQESGMSRARKLRHRFPTLGDWKSLIQARIWVPVAVLERFVPLTDSQPRRTPQRLQVFVIQRRYGYSGWVNAEYLEPEISNAGGGHR